DLFFRLNGVSLTIPPLRQRRAEIGPLAHCFVAQYCEQAGRSVPKISISALRLLRGHSWPGNIRELRNVLQRAVLICEGDTITDADLPIEEMKVSAPSSQAVEGAPAAALDKAGSHRKLSEVLASLERKYIVDTLKQCGGNQSKAAKRLGMSRWTF